MIWKLFFIIIGIILFFVLILSSCKPLKSIKEEVAELNQNEKQALEELLAATQLNLETVRPVGILGLKNNPKSLCIEKGHIVGLRLSEMSITKLDSLQKMPELKALWLDKNQFSNTTSINKLTKLEELVLDNNKIETLDGIDSLTTLENLSLSNNNLRSLPSLQTLSNLKKLILSNNQLESVENIQGLKKLKELQLNNNKLKDLSGLTDLPSLEILNLSSNELVDVEVLANIDFLGTIDISNNRIEKLPKTVKCTIKSDDNPIKKPDPIKPPANFVTQLPKLRGGVKGFSSSSLSQSYGKTTFSLNNLDGVIMQTIETDSYTTKKKVSVELSVEKGLLRVYLAWKDGDGYVYADAEPNKPAILEGYPITYSGSGYKPSKSNRYILLETPNGIAETIKGVVTR